MLLLDERAAALRALERLLRLLRLRALPVEPRAVLAQEFEVLLREIFILISARLLVCGHGGRRGVSANVGVAPSGRHPGEERFEECESIGRSQQRIDGALRMR